MEYRGWVSQSHLLVNVSWGARLRVLQCAYVLVLQVLQKLELSVGTLRQDRGAERLHDLFDCHGLASQLVFGGTTREGQRTYQDSGSSRKKKSFFAKANASAFFNYQTKPKAPMPTGWRST